MNFYRCRICGETYLGAKAPNRCPFCGVAEEYFVVTTEYVENGGPLDLTDSERADLQHAVEIERGNARFYRALSDHHDIPMLASAFKRLASVEAEHCSLFAKLLGVPRPTDCLEPGDARGNWCDGVKESLVREMRASAFYTEAAGRVSNPHVLEVLLAISAVERDHIELDSLAAEITGDC